MVETIALLWKYMYLLIYQVNLLFPLGFLEVFLVLNVDNRAQQHLQNTAP